MYKLLVVDDEKIVCQGISQSINWHDYNIEIVGTATDGKKALDLVKITMPDIVLTDIRMPEYDGIWLCEHLNNYYPNIKKIVLSAYKDFEYAKSAISSNVHDYLLKPIDVDALINSIMSVSNLISKSEKESIIQNQSKRILTKNSILIQTQLLKELVISTSQDCSRVLCDLEGLGYTLNKKFFGFIMIEVLPKNIDLPKMTLCDKDDFNLRTSRKLQFHLTQEFLCVVSIWSNFNFLVLLNSETTISSKEELTKLYTNIQSDDLKIRVWSSPFSDSKRQFGKSFQALEHLIDNTKSIYHENIFLHTPINGEQYTKSNKIPYNTLIENQLVDTIRMNNLAKIKIILNDLFHQFIFNYTPVETVKGIALHIIEVTRINTIYNKSDFIDSLAINYASLIETLYTINDIYNWLLEEIYHIIQKNNKKIYSQEIMNCISYIHQNYSEDITLEAAARHVNLSKTYLSSLFRKETGAYFTNYINDLRIEKAKDMLLNTKTINVALNVGFNDYKYFSKVFKKKTGYSPREWKKMINNTK